MKTRSLLRKVLTCGVVLGLSLQTWPMAPQISVPNDTRPAHSQVLPGESVTLLPDGKWLLLGGEEKSKPVSTAAISDPRTGVVVKLRGELSFARAWHTATLLPDGKVLVLGGNRSDSQVVKQAEIFDPSSLTFRLATISLVPRAHHAAVLLTDGRLLIAGGVDPSRNLLNTVETWDERTGTSIMEAQLPTGRRDDQARLLADGTALFWGGADDQGNLLSYGELYDPSLKRFVATTTTDAVSPDLNVPALEASIPENGATDVPLDVLIGFRFSKLLHPETVTSRSVSFQGPSGSVPALIVPAESGRLTFITPKSPLQPGTKYTLTLQGATDGQGLRLVQKVVTFTTVKERDENASSATTGTGIDNAAQALAPLQAQPGVTAVAGQTLTLDSKPLQKVTFKIDDKAVRSDSTGRFLLTKVTAGHHAMVIDGRTASRPGHTYGVFEVGVDLLEGSTTVLPYKIWMTELDTAHAVHVQFPTTQEVVVKTPVLPGLEFHIPPNTVITDIDGKVAHEISITPIPLDRPPFPLPLVQVPIYFTIQPGGGYIQVNSNGGPKGARLIYPNSFHQASGTKMDFWNYDPDTRGWFIYGQGRVSADGQSVVPDPGVVIYELTGAMVGGPGWGPSKGGPVGGGGGRGGEPVDLSTGLFVYNKTDLSLPDVIPISLVRVYRQGDTVSRAFGVGMTHPYDMFVAGNLNDFSYVELVTPDGGRVRFDRISGNGWSNSTLQCVTAPGAFYGAIFSNKNGWTITLRDGTALTFIQPGIFGPSKYQDVGLTSITDRNGNVVKVIRDSSNYVSRIVSPNGRWIQLTYDSNHRVTQVQDNAGRIAQYSYDSQGRLTQVTDANNGIWTYGWDPTNIDQMTSITDARGIQYLQNHYDGNGRVDRQIQADSSTFQFNYAADSNNNITQTSVTDPNGNVRTVTFPPPPPSPDGVFISGAYVGTDTRVVGPDHQTFTYQRDPSTNLLLSVTDSLNRQTAYTYDGMGNVTSITKLAGTPNAVTTSFAYESTFSQTTSITDPLLHKTSLSYDAHGNLVSASDPLNNTWKYTHDSTGRTTSVTDPLGKTAQIGYSGPDISSVSDPLGNTISLLTDGGGRLAAAINPFGNTTTYQYNPLNRLTQKTDSLGGVTAFQYDPNGNLLSITDARNINNPTTYAYDNMDRLQTRTDPLGNIETYSYDANGNLTCLTDRRGKDTVFQYDVLDRPIFAGLGRSTCSSGAYENTISYSYDPADRLTGVVDSVYGTITPAFDGLDRLASETTPQGSVSYQYDAAGREIAMAVAGQPIVTYAYDDAGRLNQIAQGTSNISLAYDAAGRRASLTLPNGVSVIYSYDDGSHLTGITYQQGSTLMGKLSYAYDLSGRVIQTGGNYARTGLPDAVGSATYDAANRLISWSGTSLSYDASGNLLNDGIKSYVWDSRNQLSSISGGVNASFGYDPLGRRASKTISGVTTGFLYNGLNVVQEQSGSTPTATLLTGGIDEVFSRTGINAEYFLTDGLGSTVALTDATGAPVSQYTCEPFGKMSPSGSASSNAFQYTGRENDGTGLYFYRARYYNPATGRFLSEDPLGFGGGDTNLYAYVADSPTNFTDPSGTTITVNGNGANGASYQQAIAYLMRDPGMAAIINDLIRSSTNYNIDFNSNDDDHYDPSTHTVAWDPNSALRTTNNGCQTPALGLGHEMAHADAPWWAPWVGWIPWPAYDNLEERRVITGAETSAAHTLGEGTRADHGGTPFTVPTPTSTTGPLAGRGCGCGH